MAITADTYNILDGLLYNLRLSLGVPHIHNNIQADVFRC